MITLSRVRPLFEFGLGLCVFVFLPLLALFPRAAAGLEAVAGVLALAVASPAGLVAWRRVTRPALLLAVLVVWGLASTLWAIQPARALLIDARLLGLFAAGLALVAAVPEVAVPARLLAWFCAGLALALALTVAQYRTLGALTGPFSKQMFVEPRLNQVEAGLVTLIAPLAASLALRRRVWAAALVAAATLAVVLLLVGDTAQVGLAVGMAVALPAYFWRRLTARVAAAVSVAIILTAPLIFPALIGIDALARWARATKFSMWHRLEIWSFVGAHIAQRPLLGWGLDSSRAIPGGSELTPEGVPWLPLHPHNGPLQVWLELGAPGAALFALLVARLWLLVAAAPWTRLYVAACAASLVAAFTVTLASYGLWQEWWIGSEFLVLFLVLTMGRLASQAHPMP